MGRREAAPTEATAIPAAPRSGAGLSFIHDHPTQQPRTDTTVPNHPAHPLRLATITKWIAAMVTIALVIAWVGSMRWRVGWRSYYVNEVGVREGSVYIADFHHRRGLFKDYEGPFVSRLTPAQIRWWFMGAKLSGVYIYRIPLWLPILASLSTALLAARAERNAIRRLSTHCPECNYPLSGLAPNTPCPECGTKSPAREGAP